MLTCLLLLPALPGGLPLPNITITQAEINLDAATVKGRDITIDVESDASDLFNDDEPLRGFGESLAEWVGTQAAKASMSGEELVAQSQVLQQETALFRTRTGVG